MGCLQMPLLAALHTPPCTCSCHIAYCKDSTTNKSTLTSTLQVTYSAVCLKALIPTQP